MTCTVTGWTTYWREARILMTDAETVPAFVQREIQYAAALEILHNLLVQNVIDLPNARQAAVALAETFGVLRRSI